MKFRKGLALLSSTLIGTTGLAAFALGGATSSTADPLPAKAPYGVGEAKPNTPLLYVKGDKIHDGKDVTTISGLKKGHTVVSVDRLAKGYLVGSTKSGGTKKVDLNILDRSGHVLESVKANVSYDINLAKDRVVAIERSSKRAVVVTNKGKVIGRTDSSVSYAKDTSVGFVEDEVSIVYFASPNGENQKAVRWNPKTSKITKTSAPNLWSSSVSPGGSFLVGAQRGTEGDCLGVASDSRLNTGSRWFTCDWRRIGQFSPDGTRVLGASPSFEGSKPAKLAAFGVRQGPKKPVGKFSVPSGTATALWADNDHVWVAGALEPEFRTEGNTWIMKCDLTGKCTTVATSKKPQLVLGGGVY